MPCGVTACRRGDGARSYEGLGACLELLGRGNGQSLGILAWGTRSGRKQG